ncbi:30S ribosome-binding factor RbfA [bacterium]|nr:30S ribosome-binding factor RbfA [bacterium]
MASLIRSELARLLLSEVSDPRLQALAITDVEVTKDLRQARIFYDMQGDVKEVQRGLSKATPFLRRRLGMGLEMKYVPELKFQRDEHGSQLNHLFQVMDEVKKTDALEGVERE